MPPVILGAAFLGFTILYLFAPTSYQAILLWFGFPAAATPFLDMDNVLAAIDCAGRGIDVYEIDPCDVMGRPHVYSPLWLTLDVLPLTRAWTPLCSLTLDIAFIISLAWLPACRRGGDRWIMVAACLSGAIAYLLERCNGDVPIFVLLVIGARLALRNGWAAMFGYGAITFAGLLKFYPLAGLFLMLRESTRIFLILAAGIGLLLVGLAWDTRHVLAELAPHLPVGTPFADNFGARNLPNGLVEILSQWLPVSPLSRMLMRGLSMLLLLGLILRQGRRAWALSHMEAFEAGMAALTPELALFLTLGSVILLACFLAGTSYFYRACFLLLLLPALLELRHIFPPCEARRNCTMALVWTLFLLWSETLRHPIIVLMSHPATFALAYPFSAVIWVVRELAWWHVMAVMGAVLINFARKSPLATRIKRGGPIWPASASS